MGKVIERIALERGHEIVLKKVIQTKAAAFDELFKDYKGDWRCAEVDAGMALGKEVIE